MIHAPSSTNVPSHPLHTPCARRPLLSALHHGLALLELLTVMLIISLLLAILVPMFAEARVRSERFRCMNQLRHIGSSFLMYSSDNKGRFPTTTASLEPVPPDLTSSGHDAHDPFDIGGPSPNNIPAAMFLLVRGYNLSPSAFICPGTTAVPDTLAGRPRLMRSNFSDIRRNLTYSMQNPYASESAAAAGFKWTRFAHPDMVLLADMNPGVSGDRDNVQAPDRNSPLQLLRLANSNNHDKLGQNVLYIDGRADFVQTPFVGVDFDNIYTTRNGAILDSPADPDDNILLPTDD